MNTTTHNLAFIVEDNEMYSTMLDYMLSNDCLCRFVSFKTGEECIQNLYMNPIMVILDYGLPRMDGLETLKEIKKYNTDIPVVILTNKDDKEIARNFFNSGAYEYLLKEKSSIHYIIKLVNRILNNTSSGINNKKMTKIETVMMVLFLLALVLGIFISAFHFLRT